MSLKKLSVLLGVLVVVSMILTVCPAPQPQIVEKIVTQVVKEEVKVVETQASRSMEVEKIVTRKSEKVVKEGGRRLYDAAPDPERRRGPPGDRGLHQSR